MLASVSDFVQRNVTLPTSLPGFVYLALDASPGCFKFEQRGNAVLLQDEGEETSTNRSLYRREPEPMKARARV